MITDHPQQHLQLNGDPYEYERSSSTGGVTMEHIFSKLLYVEMLLFIHVHIIGPIIVKRRVSIEKF